MQHNLISITITGLTHPNSFALSPYSIEQVRSQDCTGINHGLWTIDFKKMRDSSY